MRWPYKSYLPVIKKRNESTGLVTLELLSLIHRTGNRLPRDQPVTLLSWTPHSDGTPQSDTVNFSPPLGSITTKSDIWCLVLLLNMFQAFFHWNLTLFRRLAKWPSVTPKVTIAVSGLKLVADHIPKAVGTFQNGTVARRDCPTEGSCPNEGSTTVM